MWISSKVFIHNTRVRGQRRPRDVYAHPGTPTPTQERQRGSGTSTPTQERLRRPRKNIYATWKGKRLWWWTAVRGLCFKTLVTLCIPHKTYFARNVHRSLGEWLNELVNLSYLYATSWFPGAAFPDREVYTVVSFRDLSGLKIVQLVDDGRWQPRSNLHL